MPLLSWLGMQAAHESGHVIGAWISGGRVTQVILHPLSLSHTDVHPNPLPLLVVWMGPMIGIAIPLLFWLLSVWCRCSCAYLARFWSGFCLVANGAYIGVGPVYPVGDAQTMLQHGNPAWILAFFGILATSLGFWIWNGLGSAFGLGLHGRPVSRRHVAAVTGLLVLTVLGEVLFF
jgi:hypothetical protein